MLGGSVVGVFAVILAAQWFGQRAGMIVHEWAGFLVFVIVLGLQLATVTALRKWRPETGDRRQDGSAGLPSPASRLRGVTAAMLAGSVVLAAMMVAFAAHRLDALQVNPDAGVYLNADGRDPVSLPAFLGVDWIGQEASVSAVEHETLPPDTGYSRKTYVSMDDRSRQVFVSIVLSGRDRTSIHRPELCLGGQGWTIKGRFDHRFAYPGQGTAAVPATMLRVQREFVTRRGERVVVPSLVGYWFVGHNRVVATHWERIWWGALDRLRHLQSHRWAYVLVQTDAHDGDAAALARLQAVLDRTLPVFQKPD